MKVSLVRVPTIIDVSASTAPICPPIGLAYIKSIVNQFTNDIQVIDSVGNYTDTRSFDIGGRSFTLLGQTTSEIASLLFKDSDIVMMLRLQNERMNSSFLSSNREYYEYYGLTPDKLNYAKDDALIMHPGPMNRGIEIDTNLADDINKSVIQEQVEYGVAVRMACLKIFCK